MMISDLEPPPIDPDPGLGTTVYKLPQTWFTYTPHGCVRLSDEVWELVEASRSRKDPPGAESNHAEGTDTPAASDMSLPERDAYDAAVEPLWRGLRTAKIKALVLDLNNIEHTIPPGAWDSRSVCDDAFLREFNCVCGSFGAGPGRRPVFVKQGVVAAYLASPSESEPSVEPADPHHSPYIRVMLEAARVLAPSRDDVFGKHHVEYWIRQHAKEIEPGLDLSPDLAEAMARLLRWPQHAGKKSTISEARLRELKLDAVPTNRSARPLDSRRKTGRRRRR